MAIPTISHPPSITHSSDRRPAVTTRPHFSPRDFCGREIWLAFDFGEVRFAVAGKLGSQSVSAAIWTVRREDLIDRRSVQETVLDSAVFVQHQSDFVAVPDTTLCRFVDAPAVRRVRVDLLQDSPIVGIIRVVDSLVQRLVGDGS